MPHSDRTARRYAPLLAVLFAGLLAACSGTEPAPPPANAAAGCVDDSKRCIEVRQLALKTMLADPQRTWVTKPESPASFATGVKLFAYREVRAKLTCAELAHGREETRTMPQALKPGSVAGMNDSRAAQIRDMAGQVHKELSKQFERSCATAAGPGTGGLRGPIR